MKRTNSIMIVEDEDLFASKMEMQIDLLGHDLFARVDNSDDALKQLEDQQPDLILMDINIEGDYDGIELTDMIHQRWNIPVLFITSFHDDLTFKRISRTNPVGYIVKPFSEIQLKHSIQLVVSQINAKKEEVHELKPIQSNEQQEFIFIRKRNQLQKVKMTDIFYVEADGRYCQIYTINQKFILRIPLKEMGKRLHSYAQDFIQTHRSFLVNMKKIKSVDLDNDVIVLENRHVPLSRREKENVLSRLEWM